MKNKQLILSALFLILAIGSISAQTAPDLQLDYPWTKPRLNPSEDLNRFFIPPTTYQKPKNNLQATGEKGHERWPILIYKPDLDQMVEMPIAKMDTSVDYHLRIKDLEVAKKHDKKN